MFEMIIISMGIAGFGIIGMIIDDMKKQKKGIN